MHKENYKFGGPYSENLYSNDEAEAAARHRVPELDVGTSEGIYEDPEEKDHSVSRASPLEPLKSCKWNCPKRRLFIALSTGILIVVVIVFIVLATTGCFRHRKSKLSDLVLRIKSFSIIKCRRN